MEYIVVAAFISLMIGGGFWAYRGYKCDHSEGCGCWISYPGVDTTTSGLNA